MPATFQPVDEQLRLLGRGAVDLVEEDQLRQKLERSRANGKPLVVKTGFDPTSPDLHLGHTVLLRKMRHFQELGHTVIFLIGDFTGMIGDPSGKKSTRPQLTREQVEENAATYRRQVFCVLDPSSTVIEYNSRWLNDLGAEGLIRLAGSYTLARMMERDDFRTRFDSHRPISIHELLYPLVQGYDSIVLEADVELGGHDQILNLLVGRDLMRDRKLEPQVVLTVPLLVGTDGTEKMSKSLGNAIAVEDSAKEMYGRVMSIPDSLMWDWYLFLTDLDEEEIKELRQRVQNDEEHPKTIKQRLATQLVEQFHGKEAAIEAQGEFERVFARGEVPDDVESAERTGPELLTATLAATGLASSKSEARRLILQGAVSIDGQRTGDPYSELMARDDPYLLKVGKRRFLSVRFLAG